MSIEGPFIAIASIEKDDEAYQRKYRIGFLICTGCHLCFEGFTSPSKMLPIESSSNLVVFNHAEHCPAFGSQGDANEPDLTYDPSIDSTEHFIPGTCNKGQKGIGHTMLSQDFE